jgi:prepilin-type N-terminal cleavage/methylation domain-containing protein
MKQKGFTLIELLVVLAILGVLVALVAFNAEAFTASVTERSMAAEKDRVQSAIDIYNTQDVAVDLRARIPARATAARVLLGDADAPFAVYFRRGTRYAYLWDADGDNVRFSDPQEVPDPHLVGWWPMDEGSGDRTGDGSGHGYEGALTSVSWSPGYTGGGLYFRGSGSRVLVPDSDALDITRTLSLEVWLLRSADQNGYEGLISKFRWWPGAQRAYQLMIEPLDRISFHLSSDGGSGTEVILRSAGAVKLNAWTHVVATYDGTAMRLYVNGSPSGSLAYGGGIAATDAPLTFGASGGGGSQYFAGVLDSARIYDYALSAEQVQAHYQVARGVTASTLTLLSPNGGETVYPGSTVGIRWKSEGLVSTVTLAYSSDGFVSDAHVIVSALANTGSYSWDVPASVGGSVRLRVSDASDATVRDLSDGALTIAATEAAPVARWSLDEGAGLSVGDATGHGLNGARSAATLWADGRVNGALGFLTGDTYVQVPDSAALDITTCLTLEAWVKLVQGTAGWQTIVAKFTFGSVNERAYQLMTNGVGQLVFHLSPDGTQAQEVTLAGGSVASGVWTHVAGVSDGREMRIYVNGVQVGAVLYAGGIAATRASLMLGENSEGLSGQNLRGWMDEVAVYDVALSAATLQAHARQ